MGLGRVTSNFIHSHNSTQNQQTSWLAQGWSTFGAKKSHGCPNIYSFPHLQGVNSVIALLIIYNIWAMFLP
jgi:hypothetical protein